jgi:hypothetical protein
VLRLAAGLLLLAAAVAGEAAPEDGLVLRGVASFPAEQVRRAIAADLQLMLARRPGASPETWWRELERAVIVGYREQGFRDAIAIATAGEGGTVLTVAEGVRTRCGPLVLHVPPELEGLVRRALVEPVEESEWDIDTAPEAKPAAWAAGAAVNWNAGDRYADRITGAARRAGFVLAAVQASVQATGGVATLDIALPRPPVAVRLGGVRVAGLPPADAERLRRWLALPADAPASRALLDGAAQRLRRSASFSELSVQWEDQAVEIPPAMLAAISFNEFEAITKEDAAKLRARVLERGRADLLVTVSPVPGAALPWEDGMRERGVIVAASERMLARFARGDDLVLEIAAPDGDRIRVLWSAAHGFAALRRPADGQPLLIALADGQLVCDGPGGRLTAPMPAPQVTAALGPSRSQKPEENPFSFTLNLSGVGSRPRLQLSLLPAACVDSLLQPRAERPTVRTWDGEVLVLTYPGRGEARVDPASGVSLLILRPGLGDLRMALEEGAWAREVAPAFAGAKQPERHPIGMVVAETLTGLRATVPAARGDLLERSILMARSGSLDAFIALLGGMPGLAQPGERFSIPLTPERRPAVPAMSFMLAGSAAYLDGLLCEHLPAGAWPRLLLRSTAFAVSGDVRAAAAGLKPVVSGSTGPLGCLAIASAARLIRQDVLVGILCDAGIARCNTDGLLLEARDLAGLAPALLPAIAAGADVLAMAEADAARADRLRTLAATCVGPSAPALRLEAAARILADLGAGDWLRARLTELGDGSREPPVR